MRGLRGYTRPPNAPALVSVCPCDVIAGLNEDRVGEGVFGGRGLERLTGDG